MELERQLCEQPVIRNKVGRFLCTSITIDDKLSLPSKLQLWCSMGGSNETTGDDSAGTAPDEVFDEQDDRVEVSENDAWSHTSLPTG